PVAWAAYEGAVVLSTTSYSEDRFSCCQTALTEFAALSLHDALPISAAGCSTTASQYVSSTSAGFDGTKISYTSTNTGASGGECTLNLTPTTTGAQITTWTGTFAKIGRASCRESLRLTIRFHPMAGGSGDM